MGHSLPAIALASFACSATGCGGRLTPAPDRAEHFSFSISSRTPFTLIAPNWVRRNPNSTLERSVMLINVDSCPLGLEKGNLYVSLEPSRVTLVTEVKARQDVKAVEFQVIRFDAFKRLSSRSPFPMYSDIAKGATASQEEVMEFMPRMYFYDVHTAAVVVNRCRTGDGEVWELDEAALTRELLRRGFHL